MSESRTPRYVAESIVHDAARQFVEDDIANAIAGEFTRKVEVEAATPPLDVERLRRAIHSLSWPWQGEHAGDDPVCREVAERILARLAQQDGTEE